LSGGDYHSIMTMFVSKVWGFDNPCGPLVFNLRGWRDNSAGRLKRGDRVILVGTKGEETADKDRNRVLGMMEPSTIHVATSDFALSIPNDSRMFRADGTYRWPFGLLNYRSWEFAPGLFLDAVAPRQGNPFGSAAAAGIVPLTADEESRVLAHPLHEIPLLKPSISADRKLYGDQAAKKRGAPVPTEGVRRGIMHMRDASASVYWFQLVLDGKIVGHKIGWAFEWRRRLQLFNSVSLSPLGGLLYKVHRVQEFDKARQAFNVEQRILRNLDQQRHPGNREVLTGIAPAKIDEVWDRVVTAMMLHHV
jgi:hypothetical protein